MLDTQSRPASTVTDGVTLSHGDEAFSRDWPERDFQAIRSESATHFVRFAGARPRSRLGSLLCVVLRSSEVISPFRVEDTDAR